ncbi:MAG: NUDIX domain-containing protein [Candidatus Diapherotrites archaeon]
MATYIAAIGIVKFKDKILLLKRNKDRRFSPNKWQPVSGSIKEKETAEKAVLREVKEETGMKGKIVKAGKIFEVTDKWGRWVVAPFLVSVNSNKAKIDREHVKYEWIKPKEINRFDCVKGVKKDLKSVGLL